MANENIRPAATDVPSPKDKRTRTLLIIGGLFIFFLGSYGSGMEAEIHMAKKINEERKLAQQSYRDAQRKLRLRIASLQQLEARRQISLALTELDHRNFGTAQANITSAVKLLGDAQAASTADPDMSAELASLQKTNLAVAADVSTQREALLTIAAQMDAAFNSYMPTFVDMSVKADNAHPIVNPTMNDVPSLPGSDKGSDMVNGQEYPK